MIDYLTLKQMAKANKISVKKLLALAPQNDSFYVGTPAQKQQAEWVAVIYEELDRPLQVHIRRIHYFLVSREDIQKPNGEPYENTENDWNYLSKATKYARYLGLVPIDNFVDRRNPEPHINAFYRANTDVDEINIDSEQIAESIAETFYPYNPQHALAYHKESDKRKNGFETRHGAGATELDALEALHQGEMGDILRHEISPYVDAESYDAVIEENQRIQLEIKEALQERLEQVLSDYSLDYESNFEMPEAGLIDESDDWLFDSGLSYGAQLARYKSHKQV